MRVLHIDSSVLGEASVTRALTAAIVSKINRAYPASQTHYRNLAVHPIPYMNLATLPSSHPSSLSADSLDGSQKAERMQCEGVLDEFLEADIVVLGAPMYNFGIAAQLKSWLDAIIVPGKTFTYSSEGPAGLSGSKRVIIAIGRGSRYGTEGFPVSAEHVETYLRTALAFIGITAPEIIIAEGVALNRDVSINDAMKAVERLSI